MVRAIGPEPLLPKLEPPPKKKSLFWALEGPTPASHVAATRRKAKIRIISRPAEMISQLVRP
jgi:hypothetical protein